MIYVVSCGSKKTPYPNTVKNIYIGNLFKAALTYALNRAPEKDIYIISAKHGLLKLNQIIAPYNEKFGVNHSVTKEKITQQISEYGLLNLPVTILAGKSYVDFIWPLFNGAKFTPLKGLSLGYSIQFLRKKRQPTLLTGLPSGSI